MDNQNGTVDRMVDQLPERPGSFYPVEAGEAPAPVTSPFFGPPGDGSGTLSPTEVSEEAPAASLVGSLSAFTLADVLSMLASTSQTGELRVVSETVDGRVWLDGGELADASVGAATTLSQAVFELACVPEGWFSFTTDAFTSSGQPTASVSDVLAEVQPQVDEWREIRRVVPLEAVVTLSPDPPGQDVQIRSDQWRVLTTVGTSGHTVKSVLDLIGDDQIVGLRTLRDLHAAGLIDLEPSDGAVDEAIVNAAPLFAPPSENEPDGAPLTMPPRLVVSEDSVADDLATAPPPSETDSGREGNDRFDSLAEVAIMPPPIAGDPWAPIAESNGTDDDGVA